MVFGDTVWVSLTEDLEFEYEPGNRLAEMAKARWAVSNPEATNNRTRYGDTRDNNINSFARR